MFVCCCVLSGFRFQIIVVLITRSCHPQHTHTVRTRTPTTSTLSPPGPAPPTPCTSPPASSSASASSCVPVAALKRSLSENTVTLPPFVSSKVIMLAQHWVENTADTADTGDTHNTADTPGDGDTDTDAGRGMITLPGGAVLVAKTGQLEVDKAERGAEPPDVSITLSS